MALWRKSMLFCLGGCAYMGLELMWRGRTHGSMFLAGGLCLVLIGQLNSVEPRLPLAVRCLFGALIITSTELLFGLLVNREYTVWDYRQLPGNLWGQICPSFSLLWTGLSLVVLLAYDALDARICRRTALSVDWIR